MEQEASNKHNNPVYIAEDIFPGGGNVGKGKENYCLKKFIFNRTYDKIKDRRSLNKQIADSLFVSDKDKSLFNHSFIFFEKKNIKQK